MTKAELIEALKPFSDDIEIKLSDGNDIALVFYMISFDGESMLILSDDIDGDND